MKTKKKITVLILTVLLVVIFSGITVTVIKTTPNQETVNADADLPEGSCYAERDEAEKLIDKTLSQDEVENALGKWERFEMSSDGCERGVYAGRFYYENLILYSRTYDKGQTFHIMSIN